MAVSSTVKTRAPRGTKILTQAFFSAADNIPDAQRHAVIRAAIAAIRDELKMDVAKARVAKAKARTIPARKPAAPAKPVAKEARKTPVKMTRLGKPRGKPGPKPSMKSAVPASAEPNDD